MLGKRSPQVIGKLITNSMDSGSRAGSPRSPLDFKILSPRSLRNYDVGGVGLGIVAALENSGESVGKIQAKKALCSRNWTRSDPIPVKNCVGLGGRCEKLRGESFEDEDYTYVTCHGRNKESYTRVYCDGGDYGRFGHDRGAKSHRACVFDITPARFGDISAHPTADFLSSCHLCHKKLHGKDIYMYRGEKAYCSAECRSRQIANDERKEKCSSEASRSADVSNSPYTNGNIFSTGILAI
ncbi:hypothetical protein RJ639_026738 [Escallonia herrerae]|uniref:FLZ-type domain-containing protein n=1 Tax=Escallonia herrerae TaxID=1293975 RepID=A0AA89BGP5_9ASTE|nr:hypothetical protein RJ639_026738 [Escallonia herrerae]